MGELRRRAWERQGGLCAATGLPLGDPEDSRWDLHHRAPGGMGGVSRESRDVLSNVVCLLAEAHNMGSPRLIVDGKAGRSVHTDPLWSRPLGLLLSPRDNWRAMPCRIAGRGWVFLDDEGGWLPFA